MGVGTKRPPLPAPTDSGTDTAVDDVETDVSRMTDNSSYSIPDDGSPITISTKKTRPRESGSGKANDSQTSLLIEYFQGGKPSKDNSSSSRPSVRVKVTPSARKMKDRDAVEITEYGKDRKPSYTRRISLGGTSSKAEQDGSKAVEGADASNPPIDIDVNNPSDVSSNVSNPPIMPMTSDISSMPADSTLDGPIAFESPKKKQTSRSLGENQTSNPTDQEQAMDSLKAPPRTRSISRERILRKAAEKVNQESRSEEAGTKRRVHRREKTRSQDIVEDAYEDYKVRSRRSSKTNSRPESGDYRSGAESTYLRPREADSNVSGTSKSSFANNPRLLQTVEDAIRRMILPEIDEIKRRQQSMGGSRRDGQDASRSLAKVSSAPQMNSKDALNADEADPDVSSTGDKKRDRRSTREEGGERKHKSREGRRSSGSEGLTMAALKSHDARSRERERRERRKQSKSESRTESITNTEESTYDRSKIPPMPLRSDLADSDLTRESILSAETGDVEGDNPSNGNARGLPPVQEVSRGSPTTVSQADTRAMTQTPNSGDARNKTPTQIDRTMSPRTKTSRGELRSARSDRSISSRSQKAALAAAGLGGAAAGLYGIGRYKAERSRSRELEKPVLDKRDVSPVQSVSSYRKSDAFPEDQAVDETNRPISGDPTALADTSRDLTAPSMESVKSTDSTQYPLTQKRHQGVTLEKKEDILPDDVEDLSVAGDHQSEDDFYKEQKRLNDEYRSSGDYDNVHIDSTGVAADHRDLPQDGSRDAPAPAVAGVEQQPLSARGAGADANVVGSPARVESEVASLLEASPASSSHSRDDVGQDTERDIQEDQPETLVKDISRDLGPSHPSPSQDRWAALRQNAKALSNSKDSLANSSPAQSATRSIKSEDKLEMGASGLPVANDPMPEIGHGLDAASDSPTSPELKRETSSILEGPMGDATENRDHWPYEPTPPVNKRGGFVEHEDRDEPFISAGNAALNGAVAGLGIGAVGVGAARNMQTGRSDPSIREMPSDSSASRDTPLDRNFAPTSSKNFANYSDGVTPGYLKDEGYISAAQARSPDNVTPLSFSRPPPKLFDERGMTDSQRGPTGADPFVSDKRAKYLSGNSHGMSSPQYDASTGKGINGIQSKDVVALMDHLTVRDGQRNARDTEILVTLVRSAAETRNALDDVKKLIETGNLATIQNTEKNINKVLNAPRPQVAGSPYHPMSSEEMMPAKKGNIFKRALKGLGSKSTTDLNRIEDMLTHLLGEVETLKGSQQVAVDRGLAVPQSSLDSYEQMRAAPDSGYEPEGHAGTPSTPNLSGYFSPQSRQAQPRMHSGYSAGRDGEKRISTVLEGDEEVEEYNEDRLLTPTQEAQQQRSTGTTVFAMTPQRPSNDFNDGMEVSPPTDERYQKSKSTSSSTWGIPRISRWSKTTASSDNRTSMATTPGRKDRPYSEASHSGSDVNILPPAGAPWVTSEDDRLRSADSLAREQQRMSSPLVPDPTSRQIPLPTAASPEEMEDPKYKANRKSLTLQHPQPRQGSTHRHQTHLESQAYAFAQDRRRSEDSGVVSPENDTFGSVPSLARLPGNMAQNRYSQPQYAAAPNFSPASSGGSPVAARNMGPLVPPKVPLSQQYTREEDMYSNESPVQHADSADEDNFESNRNPAEDLSGEEDVDDWGVDTAIPLPRKRSPYSPGGLLAPIEERYSMEGDRSSIGYSLSQKSRRASLDTKPTNNNSAAGTTNNSVDLGPSSQPQMTPQETSPQVLADVMEQDESPELPQQPRTLTPRMSPRAALGAAVGGGEVRKLTGPREMPPPRKTSGDAAPAGVFRGTVRRKPVVDGGWSD